jgi:hypothetical protein
MFNLSASIDFLFLFIFFILIGLFTYYIYRVTIPSIPTKKKILLISLRTFAFSLLLLLIFEPLLTLIKNNKEKPILAILIDNSKSMSIDEKNCNRTEELKKIINSSLFSEINQIGKIEYFLFSDKIKQIDNFTSDSVDFSGNSTDISVAIKDVKKLLSEKNIQSLLIISDGQYNIGQNPIYQAELFGKQINTIGIGDSSEQKDISITKILTNNIVYKDSKVPVNVVMRSSGYKNETVNLSLQYEGNIIETKEVQLKSGSAEYNIDFTFEPKEDGIKKYTASVTSLTDEITDKNNNKSFYVKVLPNKMKVIIIAGAPSHDVSFIKNVLLSDENIAVNSFVQKLDGSFDALDNTELNETSCIYFIGFPQSNSRQNIIENIKNIIIEKNKPIFFIPDLNIDYNKLSILEPLLPFNIKGISYNEMLVTANVNNIQLQSPLMKINGSPDDINIWNQLPPLFRSETMFEKKTEAEVLSTLKINNIPFNYPLILSRKTYKQKSLAITGYGIWRWKLLLEGMGGNIDFLKIFTGNSIRWLTTRDEDKKFNISLLKDTYNNGESIEFLAELYDDSYQPIDDATVKISVKKEGELFETVMNSLGTGRYFVNIEGLGEGEYQYIGYANNGEIKLGEDNGRFSIGESNLEFSNIRMNADVLKQIAYKTGGNFYTTNNFNDVVEQIKNDINFVSAEVVYKSEFQLWNIYYTLILLILLLSMEWFIRKKSGML